MMRSALARPRTARAVVGPLFVAVTTMALSLTAVLSPPASAASLATPTIQSPLDEATLPTPSTTVSGTTADAGAQVAVVDNGNWVGVTTAGSDGSWSVPVSLLAGAGKTNTLEAYEIDPSATTAATAVGPASGSVRVSVASNSILTNGSFESPVIGASQQPSNENFHSSSSWANFSSPGPSTGVIPGWNNTTATTQCGIELQTQPTVGVQPYDGYQYLELESNCASGIVQSGIPTVPGVQYTLTFAYRARPNTTTAENTFDVQWNGTTIAPSLLGGTSSWATATYNLTATTDTSTLQFDSLDINTADSTGGFLDDVQLIPSALLAPPNTNWPSAEPIPLNSGTPNSPQTGTAGNIDNQSTINYQGEGLWYSFPVNPDEQVTVNLSGVGTTSYKVLLFSDLSKAATSSSLPVVQAESAGNNGASATFSPFYGAPFYGAPFYGAPFYGAPFYGAPFYGASADTSPFYGAPFYGAPFYGAPFYGAGGQQALASSLLAESTQTGAVDQSVQANTWSDVNQNFYVEVVGTGGVSPTAGAFTLNVSTTGGPCEGVTLNQQSATSIETPANGGVLPPTTNSAGQPYSTVIVDNSAAMPDVSQNPLSSGLTALAAANGNNGVVLDVSQSEGVSQLISQAQTNPGCPAAANLEAAGIQQLINFYRSPTDPKSLKYVVIVGDDNVIPFFRYPDAETIGPENTYQVPLLSTSSPEAALANDYYLSDDQYGAATELTISGTTLPVQTAAVGRLVQTPADIYQTILNYLTPSSAASPNTGPTIVPKATLSTGYSFMAKPARDINGYFSTGVPGHNDTLVGDAWNATQLQSALATPHQLVFVGAHFSASDALAADETTYLSTQDFAGSVGTALQGSLVLGAGCHAGYNVDPVDATPVTNPLAWPQAFSEAGATLIAGTGYQFGDSNYVADSDQLYEDIAKQLLQLPAANTPVPVGTALLDAEYQYLAGLDQLNGLAEKSLLETTLYGLPMLGVQEPGAQPASTGTGGVSAVTGFTSIASGLGQGNLNITVPAPTPQTATNGGVTYSYDSGPAGVVADPGGPVVPVLTQDVNESNYTLSGVGLWSGSYTVTDGPAPLTGDPVTDTSQPPTPFASPVYYPQRIWNPNYFGTIETGADTLLGITPEQYISDPSNPANAIKRTYTGLGFKLFYANDSTPPPLAAPPGISDVTVTTDGTNATVSATVSGDPSSPIQEVWTTYTDPSAGSPAWQSTDLKQSPGNPNVYTATFPDTDAAKQQFMVQAANGGGEVGLDNNGGSYYSATSSSSTTPPATYSLSLAGTDTADAYGTSAHVNATLSAPTGSVSGRTVAFTLGSQTVLATTNSTGTADATIPLGGLPPGTYTLDATFAPSGTADVGTTTQQQFTVTPATTELSVQVPGDLVSGQSNNGVSATLTSDGTGVPLRTVYFDVVSPASQVVASATGITNSAGTAYSGPLSVPLGDTGSGYSIDAYFGSQGSQPIPLADGKSVTATDPDYGGSTSTSGTFTVEDATQTSLVATPNPALLGQAVKLTATVSPSGLGLGPTWTAGAPATTDTVTFSNASGTVVGTVPVTVSSSGTAAATTTVSGLQGGAHQFTATFNPGTGEHILGSSGSATVDVGFTQVISGTYNNGLTIGAGQVVEVTGTVNGPVTVDPGGGLEVKGGTIVGPLRADGAVAFTLCGATVSGPVEVDGSAGLVFIGGGAACGTTTITGPLRLAGNGSGLEVTASTVNGPMSVDNNAAPLIAGNTISGPLRCDGNDPQPTDNNQLNTVSVSGGQCAQPF